MLLAFLVYDYLYNETGIYVYHDNYVLKNNSYITTGDMLQITYKALGDGTPVCVTNNGTDVYFKRVSSDDEMYYYIDLGTELVCSQEYVNQEPVYTPTGQNLYLVHSPNSDFAWLLSLQIPN